MKVKSNLRVFVTRVACFIAIGCGGGTSGTGLNTYEGRVSYEDGAPIAGAVLTLESTGDSTSTNSNGDFTIDSTASGSEVSLLAESPTFSEHLTIRNVLKEHSRIRVNVTIDSVKQRASKTDFNVKAQFVGLCDYYFENRAVIRQANHVPEGTICTIRVDVLADGTRLDDAMVALQYSSCEPHAPWETLITAVTGTEGAGEAKLSFEYKSSAEVCRYRVVAPYKLGNAWPVYYPIDTFAEQSSHKVKK